MILAGNLQASTIYPNPDQGFIHLLNLLLDPDHVPKSATHPDLPDKIFSLFKDVPCFINGCKWFLMSVCHPTYSSSTIASQGLSFLEDQMTARNLAARWQETTIQTPFKF